MAKVKMTSRILSQECLAPDIYSLWLEAGEIAAQAKPGQFISVYCGDSGRILPRPISICEIDREKGALRIVYRIAGKGTAEFAGMEAGETLDILGPLGNNFEFQDARIIYGVGGGVGISPIRFAAMSLNPGQEMEAFLFYAHGCMGKEERYAAYRF